MNRAIPVLFALASFWGAGCFNALAQEARPVGKTAEDQKRNAVLLDGYEYGKYVSSLTGYVGQDRQRIGLMQYEPAVRTRVGPRGNYKAGMAALADGKLVLATCRLDKQDPPQFAIHVYQSTDLGLTWKEIGKTPLAGKEPSLTVLRDGSLILTAQKMGAKEMHLARSSDGGETWDVGSAPGADYPRNLIVEPDGSLLMIRAMAAGFFSEDGKGSPNLELGRSRDGGRTWQFSEGVVDWSETRFNEVAAMRLKDGRLLAALRREIPGTSGEAFEDTVLTRSLDDGKHWSKPLQMTNTGEVHVYFTELHDGRILATYSNYHLPWGVYAIVSKDGGETWDLDRPIELALSGTCYVGWAVTLQLADHSLVTSYAAEVYWQQPPAKFVTEVVRWRLP
jgi:hypothetical protein